MYISSGCYILFIQSLVQFLFAIPSSRIGYFLPHFMYIQMCAAEDRLCYTIYNGLDIAKISSRARDNNKLMKRLKA